MSDEVHDVQTASEVADWRAAQTGLPLADFEDTHGRLPDDPEREDR